MKNKWYGKKPCQFMAKVCKYKWHAIKSGINKWVRICMTRGGKCTLI